ncbi:MULTISPECIES: hypothetical protein [unclassified Spirosoma]|uniref:hypothetical protein n=1 Tax=unclassified Spirosoma TaxID=2621999 RepID=UPI000963ED56|nr:MULTISPECIES: hypothetical protein [unclassified Spirosoma]MBN8825980.1 hypothetical protein [Spirosoma sp.]OJW71010.1 MAG: hypothetical protein BGO59_32875 [Spirosoma sp. 48-14]
MQPNLSHLYDTTPLWLDAFFGATTLLTGYYLYSGVRQVSKRAANRLFVGVSIWLIILALLAYNQIFLHLDARPPGLVLVIGPPLLFIIGLFITTQGRLWIEKLPLSTLTVLHAVRVPVELSLYGLYLYHQVPHLMTFEGGNVDILSGLTAPVVAYFTFQRHQLSNQWLLVWNMLVLGLVLNIVIHAILSAPFPFQQFGFDQPNVGILKVPYVWLPGFVVPTVLFAHLVAIYRLIKKVVRNKPS